jgi:hypothetical protein
MLQRRRGQLNSERKPLLRDPYPSEVTMEMPKTQDGQHQLPPLVPLLAWSGNNYSALKVFK